MVSVAPHRSERVMAWCAEARQWVVRLAVKIGVTRINDRGDAALVVLRFNVAQGGVRGGGVQAWLGASKRGGE